MNFELWTEDGGLTLTHELGISLWNIAVNETPYRTGNARSQVSLNYNTHKKKMIVYNDYNAYYINYLEEGAGRNKKHKGFIENKTVGSMLSEIIKFEITGKPTFSQIPTVTFRTDRARNYERQMMRKVGISHDQRVSAKDRATMSRVYAGSQGLSGSGYSSNDRIINSTRKVKVMDSSANNQRIFRNGSGIFEK
jgi:hypothetical protein